MESIKNNPILKFQPNPVQTLWKKYNMDNGRMEQSLDLLEEWIKKQRHFVCHEFDRNYLDRTIISVKGSLEKAKRQTDRLCTLRTLVPKFFVNADIRNNFKEMFDVACLVVLPKQTKDYQRIMMLKLHTKKLTAKLLMDFYKFLIILCEYLKWRDYSDGFIGIIDLRDGDLLDLLKIFNPVDVQQILTVMIEGYGARIKGIHLMSHSKAIDLLMKMLKQFLSQKIADRIHVHQENEELYSTIDRDILPIEFGGKERSIHELSDRFFDELCTPKFESYLVKMTAMRTDESLRLIEKFNEDCVGLPGSFRTMSVD